MIEESLYLNSIQGRAIFLYLNPHLGRGHRTQLHFRGRIFSGIPLCANRLEHPTIRTWSHHIMLYKDSLPLRRPYHRRRLVAICKVIAVCPHHRLIHLPSLKSIGLHCRKVLHVVRTVYIKEPTSWSYTVCRVDIACMPTCVLHAPRHPTVADRVCIASFNMYKLTE
jgi:hypothetical protein